MVPRSSNSTLITTDWKLLSLLQTFSLYLEATCFPTAVILSSRNTVSVETGMGIENITVGT